MASLLPRVDYCEEREKKNEFIKLLDGHWWNIIFCLTVVFICMITVFHALLLLLSFIYSWCVILTGYDWALVRDDFS